MRLSKLTKPLACWLAVAYLATGGLGASCVLCIGENGHVSFEVEGLVCGSCCSGAVASRRPEEPCHDSCRDDCLLTENPCGACWDIPILVDSGFRVARGSLEDSAPAGACPAPACFMAVLNARAIDAERVEPSRAPVRADLTLKRIRVIVLRC